MKEKNINIYGWILRILVIAFVVASFFELKLLPREEDNTFWVDSSDSFTDDILYKGDFYWIKPDGTKELIELSGVYDYPLGEPFVIETTLPSDYKEADIITRAAQQNMKIYVGDELRVDYDTENTRPVGSQTTSRYVFCNTDSNDAGKTLRIETVSYASGYSGRVNPVFACDRYTFWKYIYSQYGTDALYGAIVILMGLFTVCISIALNIGFRDKFDLEYIGWCILLVGTWLVCESKLRQLFSSNASVLSNMGFIVIMLAPIPLIVYINGIQKSRYAKVFRILFWITFLNIVIQNALQILDVLDFIDMLLVSHVLIGIAFFTVLSTFFIDYKKGHIGEYRTICIGFFALMLSVMIEVITLYFVTMILGFALTIGVFFFVGTAIMQTINDVRMLEQKRRLDREAKIAADNANRAKSIFLANMSHEIRTPMNAILGLDTMILRNSEDKEIRQYASEIQSAGRTLLTIINDILDFSKIESGKMELIPAEFAFPGMIKDVHNMISTRAGDKSLEFVLEMDENIPIGLVGDDVRIKQILTNLLTNAVKYTHKGKVSLQAEVNRDKANLKENEISIHFAVSDTGIGIKPEDISKLTEEFVRIEESRNRNIEGTGLGLNIVSSLLLLMGSNLEVSSVYGEGSEFSFDLVLTVSNSEPIGNINDRINEYIEDEDSYRVAFCIPDSRLLVVDDNKVNRMVFINLVSDMKCHIDEADSGYKCLDLVKENKYDIIFMDHMMPEMDGVETLQAMKELGGYINSDTPVVVMTANAINGVREEYLAEGFSEYLSKPIEFKKLEAVIDKLIDDSRKVKTEK